MAFVPLSQSPDRVRYQRVLWIKWDASHFNEKIFKVTGDLPQNVNYAVKTPYLSVLLASTAKGKKGRSISIKDNASLADLAENIKNSVMIVVAESLRWN